MPPSDPSSREEALHLLRALGAKPRLVLHGATVSEVAVEVSTLLTRLGVKIDEVLVVTGAVLHDAGKIIHPEELDGPGRRHEDAGERLLQAHGVSPRLARVCRTHGAWDGPEVTLEEQIVALGDNLWCGRRTERLESLVGEAVSSQLGLDRWEAFLKLDPEYERIAAGASDRLARAQV